MTSSTNGHETSWQDSRPAHMQYGWKRPACLLVCLLLPPCADADLSFVSSVQTWYLLASFGGGATERVFVHEKDEDSNKWVGCAFRKKPGLPLATHDELTLKKQQAVYFTRYIWLVRVPVANPYSQTSPPILQQLLTRHVMEKNTTQRFAQRTAHWTFYSLLPFYFTNENKRQLALAWRGSDKTWLQWKDPGTCNVLEWGINCDAHLQVYSLTQVAATLKSSSQIYAAVKIVLQAVFHCKAMKATLVPGHRTAISVSRPNINTFLPCRYFVFWGVAAEIGDKGQADGDTNNCCIKLDCYMW